MQVALSLRCRECGVSFEMPTALGPTTTVKLSIRPKSASGTAPAVFMNEGMPAEGELEELPPLEPRGAAALAPANDIPNIPAD